jgi:putative MATE family efflux protein
MNRAAPQDSAQPAPEPPAPAAPGAVAALPLPYESEIPAGDVPDNRALLRILLWLALPVVGEHLLHMVVGLTDVYLASHLPVGVAAPATAAVGSVAYILWLFGLVAGAIGTGSTAIVARAVGARHRALANSVCGQTVTVAAAAGLALTVLVWLGTDFIVGLTGLSDESAGFARYYLRAVALSLPFSTLMFAANACLRGAGDTFTPAVSMIVVDVVNLVVSASLTLGWLAPLGVPALGFKGIAIGTFAAYVCGGLLQFFVLLHGRGGLKLHLHRLRPHWITLKRILRIGIPSGAEGLLSWVANFAIIAVINRADRAVGSNLMGSAHILTIRIESLSYLIGMAVATAAATMVGQSLGMKSPARATRSAYLAYAVGGGVMAFCGVLFLLFPHQFADFMTADKAVADLTARCLRITSFAQVGFAAALVFGGALRGAGDTVPVMLVNLSSQLTLRLIGVLLVGRVFNLGLAAIWVVLSGELTVRGLLVYLRFAQGGWRKVKV